MLLKLLVPMLHPGIRLTSRTGTRPSSSAQAWLPRFADRQRAISETVEFINTKDLEIVYPKL